MVQKISSGQLFADKGNNAIIIDLQEQGSLRLEKYLKMKGFLEKSLKTDSVLKSTGKSMRIFEKYLIFNISRLTVRILTNTP